jgi:hypothetical protein
VRAGTRDRTEDIPLKRRKLYQLSYTGESYVPPLGLEPRTLRLRGGCSNQLSYRGRVDDDGAQGFRMIVPLGCGAAEDAGIEPARELPPTVFETA